MNILLGTILLLLVGGTGAEWLNTLLGISWVPAILLTMLTIVVAGVLLVRIGSAAFALWWRAEGLFTLGTATSLWSVMATWLWFETDKPIMGWAALILLIIAIICFIRYSCRWNNWCHHFNNWWTATGWPAIRVASARVFTWFRGPFLHSVVVASRTTGNALGFIAQNIRIIHMQWLLLLVTGCCLYYSVFQGPLWISAWLWALLFAGAILWRFAIARQLMLGLLERMWQAYIANWGRISGASIAMLVIFAGLWLWLCVHLLQMWKNNEVVVAFSKEYTINILSVGGVFLVGLLGWLLWQAFAGHGPRPSIPPQANRRGRRAGAHP